MEKNYDHSSEDNIYKRWKESGKMRADNKSTKPPFTIPLPPPNVTGQLHLGHAAMLAIEDILIRFKKMTGHESLWIPGTDHAAIATENVVIKHLGIKSREELSREDFLIECRKFAAEKRDRICHQMEKMGAWLDWSREAYTFDEERNFAVNKIFKKLYEDDLIVRGHRMINWSVGAQSVLADDEVEWEEQAEPFYYIKCGEFIMGTVRSETKCADSPLVVHPEAEYVRIKLKSPKTDDINNKSPQPPLPRGSYGNEYKGGNLPYLEGLKERARELRSNQTPSEIKFWQDILKSDNFEDLTFLKQKPLDKFIVDFYCSKLGLVIEIDGDIHNEQKEYDEERSAILEEKFGLFVLRYSNEDVLNNIEKVKADFIEKIKQREKDLQSSPLGKGDLGDLKDNTFIIVKNLFDDKERLHKVLNLLKGEFELVETFKGSELVGREFEDETYAGKRKFFVIADEIIDPNKGTGAMTISCNHSADDYDIGKRLGLDEFFFDKLDFEGKMKAIAGECAGLTVKEARLKSAEIMKEKGLLVGIDKEYNHRVPICYRSGCVVEPMVSPQWFIAVEKEFDMPKTQRVIFARHGESVDNSNKLIQHQDSPLTEKGEAHAENIAKSLQERKISKIISSPTTRALETAKIVGKKLGLPVETLSELGCGDCGKLKGTPQSNTPKGMINIQFANSKGTGEKIEDYFERVKTAYEKIKEMSTDGEILVVGHRSVFSGFDAKNLEEFIENRCKNNNLNHGIWDEREFETSQTETTTLKKILQSAVRDGHVKIIPERFEKIYFQWIDNLRDWCISRQIWWGHRIPVWYDKNDKIHLPEEKELIFARHGQSEANAANIFQGIHDTPLTEKGREQAKELAESLKDKKISKVICSDLKRAHETAQIVATELGIKDLEVTPELREMDFGELNGKTKQEVFGTDETYIEHELPLIFDDKIGDNFEVTIAKRKAFLDRVRKENRDDVLIVSHETTLATVFGAYKLGENLNRETFATFAKTFHMKNAQPASIPFFVAPEGEGERQKFVFARHGQTKAITQSLVQAPNDSLNESGIDDAKHLAENLKSKNITKIVSSGFARALETAEIVGKELGVKVEVCDTFNGFDFDEICGTPINPNKLAAERAAEAGTGETPEIFFERMKKAWEEIKAMRSEGEILVVGHRTNLCALDAIRAGESMEDFLERRRGKNNASYGYWGETTIYENPLRQDTDTLDTWFSSALWPFSTLGWPNEEAPDLQKFYPTDVLETGHDILFFWVARMLMFGKYATGKFPFHTTYLHGLVTDEHGKKMSKSKGNGVDPIEIIEQYGADPVRLALVIGSAPGQNIPIGEAKISGYRNFVNKLWNAGRFVRMQVGEDISDFDTRKIEPQSVADKWILARFTEVTNSIKEDLNNYRISNAGDTVYHFVWGEFCDWYIEASKVSPNPDFLAWLYFEILKLVHPLCPFVTDDIYQNFWGKDETLMDQGFPVVDFVDAEAVTVFEKVKSLVTEVRSLRADEKINPKEKLVAQLVGDLDGEVLNLIEVLAGIKFDTVEGENVAKIVVEDLEVLIQIPVDEARVAAEIAKLKQEIVALEGRLSNKKYVDNAPEKLVADTRANLEKAKEKLGKMEG